MLKHYTFNNINESEQESNQYSFDNAIKAAMDKGLGKPDQAKLIKSHDGKWDIAVLIYGDSYGGDKYIYSYKSDKILNDEPVNRIDRYKGQGNYLIVSKYTGKLSDLKYNFLDERGFTLKNWVYNIYGSPDENGYHIMVDDEGYNLIDVNGEKGFEDPKNNIEWYGDYLFVESDDESILFDKNGKIKLEGIDDIKNIEYEYYDEDDNRISDICYQIQFDDMMCLYNSNMELIVENFDDLNDIDNFFYISTYDNIHNIIGPDGKMVFGKDPQSKEGWIDSIEETPEYNKANLHLVEKNDTYNLFDGKHLKLIDDVWYDEIKFIEMNYLDIDLAAAVIKDGKCNFLVIDPDSYMYMKFLFDEPVDDIKKYEDFIVVTKDNQDYLVWKNQRLMMVEFDKIYQTEYDTTYTIIINDKFDFISTLEADTFCELYMNGKKFDACFDITSYYPLVEYNGKYSYVNAETFEPLFGYKNNKQMTWFDDAEPVEEDEDGGFDFNVVINGEKKRLDEWGDDRDDPDY